MIPASLLLSLAALLLFVGVRLNSKSKWLEARRHCLSPSSERPRRGELVEMGLVEESGAKRPTLSGRAATVWRVTDAGRRMLEPEGA